MHQPLKNFNSGAPTISNLLELASPNWLGDITMSAGLDTIRNDPLYDWTVYHIASPYFFHECVAAFTHEDPEWMRPFKSVFNEICNTVKYVCFPLCHSQHWFIICISLADGVIHHGDGFSKPKANLPERLFEIIENVFSRFVGVATSTWNKVNPVFECVKSPRQTDGHSCGIVCLVLIERFVLNKQSVDWNPANDNFYRAMWLERCISLHKGKASRRRNENASSKPDIGISPGPIKLSRDSAPRHVDILA